MAASETPVVCTYPSRNYAAEFAAVLREQGVSAAVVPSDGHAGEWDVLVAAHDAALAAKIVRDLLASD